MQNIPVFTTEFGVASLILKEIPYNGSAYIRVLSSLQPQLLLEECMAFCRAAGAEWVYADSDGGAGYPVYTQVIRMQLPREKLPTTSARVVPVTEQTLQYFRQIYNQKMAAVDNASYMTDRDTRQLLNRGDGYFVQKDGVDAAIVIASAGRLDALASMFPGGGREGVLVLKELLTGDTVTLDVASTNTRAVGLYESLGFTQTEVLTTWYKIL